MDLDIQENLARVQNMTRREQEKTPVEFTCQVCKRKIHQKSYSNTFNYICKGCKAKKTSVAKYGTPNIGILKARASLQKKYGVSNPSYLESVKEKRKQTCLEKYGVDNAVKSEEIKEKTKSTNVKRYGVECTLWSKETHSKVKETNLKKYGNECYLASKDAREKSRKTCLEKYGVEYAAQNRDIIAKSLESKHKNNEEKYRQHSELMLKAKDFKFSEVSPLLYNVTCPVCNNSFLWTDYEFVSAEHCMKILYCKNCAASGRSSYEDRIADFFPDEVIVKNDRTVIKPKELDLYFPEKKLAVEFDGIFWHNGSIKSLEKYELCKKLGIRLVNIFEHEYSESKIKSIIKTALGEKPKHILYARKCEIRNVREDEYKKFVIENHIQNYAYASVIYGLYYDNELVQIMSFSKPRFNKKYEWEIIRECSKCEYSIVGGKERLWRHFLKEHNPASVISYCDKRFFTGESYLRLGFSLAGESKPSYFYANKSQVLSRYSCQKHKLSKLLGDKYDDSLTEKENMLKAGYFQLFDFGQLIFSYKS